MFRLSPNPIFSLIYFFITSTFSFYFIFFSFLERLIALQAAALASSSILRCISLYTLKTILLASARFIPFIFAILSNVSFTSSSTFILLPSFLLFHVLYYYYNV